MLLDCFDPFLACSSLGGGLWKFLTGAYRRAICGHDDPRPVRGRFYWRKLESPIRLATSRDPSEVRVVDSHPVIIICDMGRGVGSELSLVMLRVMRDLGHLNPKVIFYVRVM